MKKHVLFFIAFLVNCNFLFSQKNGKTKKWIKNTMGISYEEKLEDMDWFIFERTTFTDSTRGLNLKLIKIGLINFTKSGNFHEFEISDFQVSLKKRKLVGYDEIGQVAIPTRYSRRLEIGLNTKWQYNFNISAGKSKNKFFIGAGLQPYYQLERLKPVRSGTFPHHLRRKTRFGSDLILAPRIVFIKKNKYLLDVGLSKSIYRFQKIMYKEKHGVPDRQEKFSNTINNFMPVDFELNIGIGFKLNSKKEIKKKK